MPVPLESLKMATPPDLHREPRRTPMKAPDPLSKPNSCIEPVKQRAQSRQFDGAWRLAPTLLQKDAMRFDQVSELFTLDVDFLLELIPHGASAPLALDNV